MSIVALRAELKKLPRTMEIDFWLSMLSDKDTPSDITLEQLVGKYAAKNVRKALKKIN